MNYLLQAPTFWLFSIHLMWIGLFVYGNFVFWTRVLSLPSRWCFIPLYATLLFPCFVYSVQMVAIFSTGSVIDRRAFWLFPLVGSFKVIQDGPRWFKLIRSRVQWPVVVIGFIFLVLCWTNWSSPFTESTNGHHHYIFSIAHALLFDNRFPFVAQGQVCYDNAIALWPPLYSLLGTAVSLPIAWGGLRPVFIFPALVFLAIACLCYSLRNMGLLKAMGPLLLVGGSYYIANCFTDFTYDTLTPLWQVFFLFQIVWALQGRPLVFGTYLTIGLNLWIATVLFFLRPHALFVTGVFISAILLVGWKLNGWPWSFPSSKLWDAVQVRWGMGRSVLLFVLIVSAWGWGAIEARRYGNPLVWNSTLPHFMTLASWAKGTARTWSKGPDWSGPLPQAPHAPPKVFPWEITRPLRDFVLTYLLSKPHSGEGLSWLKAFCVGLAFPIWALLLLGVWACRSRGAFCLFGAWVLATLAGYHLLGNYPKLSSFMAIPLAASIFWFIPIFDPRVFSQWNKLLVGSLVVTVLFASLLFFYNQSGHRARSEAWTLLSCFPPRACMPFERLGHRTSSPVDLKEFEAYQRLSFLPAHQILLSNHEPLGLFPSLAGVRLWEVRWYTNTRAPDLWNATDLAGCRKALNRLDIQWIQRPGNSHGAVDDSFFLQHLSQCPSPFNSLVSVETCFNHSSPN